MNKLRVYTRTRMSLKSITLSEKRQTKKEYAVGFHLHGVQGQAELVCGAGCEQQLLWGWSWRKGPRENSLVRRECSMSWLKGGGQSAHISQGCGWALSRWVPFSPCTSDLHAHTSSVSSSTVTNAPLCLAMPMKREAVHVGGGHVGNLCNVFSILLWTWNCSKVRKSF